VPIDLYTKLVLTAIAAALSVLCLRGLSFVSRASAQSSTHCTGTLTANAFGGTEELTGGYEVDVSCR
jgi:hypothetical protein